nr:hypothetical protein [Paenibacillus hemerocallicola]
MAVLTILVQLTLQVRDLVFQFLDPGRLFGNSFGQLSVMSRQLGKPLGLFSE